MAVPSTVRLARTGEVLDLLRRGGAETTADLAAEMGVARSTVTERLEVLFQHGLIVTVGETSGARGRPASRLAFNAAAGVTLAAQVGMSGVLMAVTDLAAEVLWYRKVDLDVSKGPEELLRVLDAHFGEALQELGPRAGRLYGMGIGLAGDLEIAGTAVSWRAFPLTDRLRERFGCPVLVDRDVNFLALGEHRTAWPDARVFLCLKVGTQRHILRGNHASGHRAIGPDHLPLSFILIVVSFVAQYAPCFFDGNVPESLEDSVGNLRTAIGKALSFPFDSECLDVFG